MKELIFSIPMALIFGMCEPKIPVQYPTAKTVQVDTIKKSVISDSIVIVIYPEHIKVRSKDLTSDYTVEAGSIKLDVNPQFGLEGLSVNNVALLKMEHTVNHVYQYLDESTIIVQPNNTLTSIVQDHRKMGFNVTMKSIHECNPFLTTTRPLVS